MKKWDELADEKSIERTVASLKTNGIEAMVVDSIEEARKKVLEIIPKGAEVMTMSSVTLDKSGITQEIMESGNYNPVRKTLMKMDRNTQGKEMNMLGAAPEWAVGSAHAVTEEGNVLIASNTGSQLPAYAYAAGNVLWVVGTQKIVKNVEDGIKRIYEYVLPLENERAKKAYGVGSFVSKLLIVNRELVKGRIKMVLVKEKIGF